MKAKEIRDLSNDELQKKVADLWSCSICASARPPDSWKTPPALKM